MSFKLKNKNNLNLKAITFLVLFICCCQKNIAQEFEWAYTIPGIITDSNIVNRSSVHNLITNSNNEIYIAGTHHGTHNFGSQIITSNGGSSVTFLAKLDENKNLIWIRLFKKNLSNISLTLDNNENVVLGGYFLTNNSGTTTSVSLDPDFHPTLNPVNVHENLETYNFYGFVLKINDQGNYINSKIFKNILIRDIIVDNDDNIIAVGATTRYEMGQTYYLHLQAYMTKLDSNFNTILNKTYSNANTNFNGFFKVGCDSQNNLYYSGTYRNTFSFGSTTLINSSSEFICKMFSNGNEDWIVELHGNPVNSENSTALINREIQIDADNNVYFFSNYDQSYLYNFTNIAIGNFPFSSNTFESVLFKIDSNGNHIWNIPLHGNGDQKIINFKINNDGELITIINSDSQNLHYSNDSVLEANDENFFLLKINEQGDLIDFKRLDTKNISDLEIDTQNNILLGGFTYNKTDFDPHPFNDYLIYTATSLNDFGEIIYEVVAYVLKLTNCDNQPLFLGTYNFCSANNPNPTIGDIEPNDHNIKWFSTQNSLTSLNNNFPIVSGTTYYMEKTSENCPVLLRQPVLISILLPPSPPLIAMVQPCYFQGMKLSDLDIQGTDILFYDSLGNILNSNTTINLNTEYFVTQTINNCESSGIRINLENLSLITPSQVIYVCDYEKDNMEVVNLSNYIHHFTATPNIYSISYYNSYNDAFNNVNAILNYTNFTTENLQTVYLRFYSNYLACFEVVELTMNHVFPPEILEIQINDLAANNSITVIPYNENYVYSLNGTNFQTSNYFDNLSEGEYFVYVKDKSDTCQPVTETAFLLAYPKFFSPNGDGYNDKWKIKFSNYQELLNVEIYDRYGQLIIFLEKDSPGWDGTLNGKTLPATDYWFKLIRVADKKTITRGHFTLLR
jgi:gliding motility-associated-like protein